MVSQRRGVDRAGLDRRLRSVAQNPEMARAEQARVTEQLEVMRQRGQEFQLQRIEMNAQSTGHLMSTYPPKAQAAASFVEAARAVIHFSVEELWVDYFALGGNATVSELAAILAGDRPMLRPDYDRLAVAMNERFFEMGLGRPLSYWDGSR